MLHFTVGIMITFTMGIVITFLRHSTRSSGILSSQDSSNHVIRAFFAWSPSEITISCNTENNISLMINTKNIDIIIQEFS